MNRTDLPGPILIVEDDRNTAALVAAYLEREGFRTRQIHDGAEALALARRRPPGFVILDVMLPGIDGWEICRELRKFSDVPILLLTAREEEIDRVLGLSLGADDYVVKPFSPRELVERVKAILRRARSAHLPDGVLARGGIVLDPARHKVTANGRPVELTAVEYKLLQALMSAPGRLLSREELLGRLYPHGETVVDRVIDVHIGKLRQKIGDDPEAPRYIRTVRGFGYRFADEGEE
jgi:DNA-binding response OmpR family regulator